MGTTRRSRRAGQDLTRLLLPLSLSRRRFLVLSGAATTALAFGACSNSKTPVGAESPAVDAAERRRRRPDARVHDVTISAGSASLDTGSGVAATWAYDGVVPGPEIRLTKGDVLRARLTNNLPDPTSIHWHGLAIRNDMDGVPGLTQEAVQPGQSFTYQFAVPDSGTFWFHPHSGLQADRGLYAPLIIDDPAEPGSYDRELVIVLDDWTDGIGESPDAILRGLTEVDAMHHSGDTSAEIEHGDVGNPNATSTEGSMQSAGTSPELGGDAGDVTYPLFLLNGRAPANPAILEARPGERLRLRFINAGADTAFRVALGGHQLTVTHTDGFPVEPVTVDTILIGMAERYDIAVTVPDSGVFPLVALAEGKGGQALALLRTGAGDTPPAGARPVELDGRLLTLADLAATRAVSLSPKTPDRTHRVVLTNDSDAYRWRINGKTFDDRSPLELSEGERVRLVFDNRTTMFHPMHLHGHTFQVQDPLGTPGPRKDTVIVRPKEKVAIDFVGDNPGEWLLHCHTLYHQEVGMTTTLAYVA